MKIHSLSKPDVAHLPMDLYLNITNENCWSVIHRVGQDVPIVDVEYLLRALTRREMAVARDWADIPERQQ